MEILLLMHSGALSPQPWLKRGCRSLLTPAREHYARLARTTAKTCCSTPPADSRSNRSPVPCIRGLRATPGTRRKLQPSWRFDSVHTYRNSYPSFTGFSPCAHEDTEKRSFFLKQCARKLHTAHKPRCASCLLIPARLARKTATTCCRIPPADSRSSRSPVS